MAELLKLKYTSRHIRLPIISILIILLITSITFAHGPKGHSGANFTHLQAVQKGVALYDRLVTSGKLEESWETDLTDVEVSSIRRSNDREFVVKFSRSEGEPKSVYIFFTENGEYNGSNFTGK